jgi:hypothetical protein
MPRRRRSAAILRLRSRRHEAKTEPTTGRVRWIGIAKYEPRSKLRTLSSAEILAPRDRPASDSAVR